MAKSKLKVIIEDARGEPFLILSICDVIARQSADLFDMVALKKDAMALINGAVTRGEQLHQDRQDAENDRRQA